MRENKEVEIGYWFGVDYHGKGLASKALACVLKCLDGHMGHDVFLAYAEAMESNKASLRVLEKNGFRITGKKGRRQNRIRLEYSL